MCAISGLLVCRGWNGTVLTIAMISQTEPGETTCCGRLTELQRYFSVDLAVMTGSCAGVQDVEVGIEYGCVVVAERTVMEEGIETPDGEFLAHGNPAKLDENLSVLIKSSLGKLDGSRDWLNVIPHEARFPSPRYAQEIVISEVFKRETGLKKKDLFAILEGKEDVENISCRTWDTILTQAADVAGLVSISHGIVSCTEEARAYERDAYEFPRRDEIKVVVDSIGSVRTLTKPLPNTIATYRKRMANWRIRGIDVEAHQFMTHSKAAFPDCLPLVMKGISDYGDRLQHDYYQEYAASTPIAFLRHLLTRQPFLEFLSRRFHWEQNRTRDQDEQLSQASRLSRSQSDSPLLAFGDSQVAGGDIDARDECLPEESLFYPLLMEQLSDIRTAEQQFVSTVAGQYREEAVREHVDNMARRSRNNVNGQTQLGEKGILESLERDDA
ncbi:uncharacterized protein LOC134191155 [Corticium candelabrum]|uniref:uncharacterized protein LOC134191155 n=1 Tax=Corticium candelabrum TaxID=121492 RepID=UPI002E2677CF|nr:uncharacterized protein LOC134191155 [Corticium candelabrum]